MQHYRPKVFFIGYNKTGTTSFHQFFKNNGYTSFHHSKRIDNKRKYLGNIIKNNLRNNVKLLDSIENQDVYSEFCLCTNTVYFEGSEFFDLLDYQYPESYFILQTRNEDDWIKSRFMHKLQRKDSFKSRASTALSLNDSELETFWRHKRRTVHNRIEKYFESNNKFIKYDLDHDNIDKIINFLSQDYFLDKKYWKKHNVTPSK